VCVQGRTGIQHKPTDMARLTTNIAGIEFRNPVLTASGTFGYGPEFADFVNFSNVGGIIVKGTTLKPREGNPYPRMAETPSGMLNCVGLQNKGVEHFVESIYPEIANLDTRVIVNVAGSAPEDYAQCAARLLPLENIPCIELNISCPNVKNGGMAFGITPSGARSVVAAVREAYSKPIIVKLSPNVTDIAEIARAVEDAGADAVSLINTLMGMAIDIERRRPRLSIGTGGLSGPAVKPVAVRMVWQVAKAVKIPVIGLGGITTPEDAIEFLMAGARAIEIGTANFLNPAVAGTMAEGINRWLDSHGCRSVDEIIGAVK
jgi:dihydroorotate dehydrogenase (NAD+) catalytic subunit